MIDPRLLLQMLQAPAPAPTEPPPGLLQMVQNDNVPASSRYGVDAWNPMAAMAVRPGPTQDVVNAGSLRPNMYSTADSIRATAKRPANFNWPKP